MRVLLAKACTGVLMVLAFVAPLALLASVAPLAGAQSPATPTVVHTWRPVRAADGEVAAIDVRMDVNALPNSVARRFALNVPITYAGVPGIAERTQQLTVRDMAGDVPLTVVDDAPDPGGFPFYRHWRATRAVSFPVVVTYRALAPRVVPRGPPFGLYAAHGGVSGAGSGFLVLPETDVAVTSKVQWDLSDLPAGAMASTSFGEGDIRLIGAPARLRQGWIMAGPLGRYPSPGATSRLQAVWLGTPAWDPTEEMQWASRMYEWLATAYSYLQPAPSYRVFVRVGTARGGTALDSSFMILAAPRDSTSATTARSPRETITHELGHLFVGQVVAPLGVGSWFSEGLNVYYTRLLPMRGGFTSVEQYGREVNAAFREYWSSPSRNLSADSIVRIGFTDEGVRHMPYGRGSLYFADLDAKIRAHSRGKRSLDVVVRELFGRRAMGDSITHERWMETVVREAGRSARDDFEHIILRGDRTLLPASDAFGPCFERRPLTARGEGNVEHPASYEWVRVTTIPDSTCRNGPSR